MISRRRNRVCCTLVALAAIMPVATPEAASVLEEANQPLEGARPGLDPSTIFQRSTPLPTRVVRVGTKISSKTTDSQIDFVNNHYAFVVTDLLDTGVREKINGPALLLYRSIQDGWPNFHHFDWPHMNARENMFCHCGGKRIKTVSHSWLMNGGDLVDPSSPRALDHWVNYYAVSAAKQVRDYDYDGLFIDCAGHKLSPGIVQGSMPEGYNDTGWRDGRYAALKFIKSYLPDKLVTFNGLHSGNGAEQSLRFTDGGMWEVFAFAARTGAYFGENKWAEALEIAERNRADRMISLVAKRKNLTKDIPTRMFILASYLLVSSPNVVLTMADLDYGPDGRLLYYPEYDIDPGRPLGSYTIRNRVIYERKFEKGMVLVNPSAKKSCRFSLDRDYDKVIPAGGGRVREDGTCEGLITYEAVKNEIVLPPLSGIVLINR